MGILTTGFMAKYAIIQCLRLQSKQRSLQLQVKRAKTAVSNMEKQMKNSKNYEMQQLKSKFAMAQAGLANGFNNTYTQATGQTGAEDPLSMNGTVFSAGYMKQYGQLQAWMSQQMTFIETKYEAQLEAMLEPLKQDEEDLETEKLDADNDLAYWQSIRDSYKQQSKEDIKSFVS